MGYITAEDIQKKIRKAEFDRLTLPKEDETITQDEIVENAIGAADAEIDTYISGTVVLPYTTPPNIIKSCSVDIAIYHLHSRIQYDEIPELVAKNYDNRIKWLTNVAKGIANIDPAQTEEQTETTIEVTQEERIFDRGSF